MIQFPDRLSFAHLPTPLEPLERLTAHLEGPEIWIKRDDQTGLAGGGNKTRKLEFLLADAQRQGCDHLITMGAPQSNHCRQTAASAARFGMGCSLVLRGKKGATQGGNFLLDQLMGAHIYWTEGREPSDVAAEIAQEVQALGRKPYLVPYGGSNVLGATSYVVAMREMLGQMRDKQLNFDFVVVASSSGGTQAGLVLGAVIEKFQGQVLGISIDDPAGTLHTHVATLATATAAHLGLDQLAVAEHVRVNDDYCSPGYAVLTETEREAIEMLGQKEGILLDPVYTGRAMGGLIDLIRWGAFTRGQRILFWHTGGLPALFAYADQLFT